MDIVLPLNYIFFSCRQLINSFSKVCFIDDPNVSTAVSLTGLYCPPRIVFLRRRFGSLSGKQCDNRLASKYSIVMHTQYLKHQS